MQKNERIKEKKIWLKAFGFNISELFLGAVRKLRKLNLALFGKNNKTKIIKSSRFVNIHDRTEVEFRSSK